jgi:hypothetical protein
VRRSRIRIAVVQITLATAFSFSVQGGVEQLAWLAGCWRSDTGNRQNNEQWMQPAGKMMLGMSHTVVNGKTREYEFIRIVQEENGDIFFIATPSGQKEARFKMTSATEREARFENPAHDFPQRIIYRREGDSLIGRIEGTSNGKERAVDFPLKRISCESD